MKKIKYLGRKIFFSIKESLFENKSPNQSIIKNTFWLFIAEGVNKGLMFFLLILVARYFGVEVFGKFSFALNFSMLFVILADFGLSTLTIRELARNKELTKKYIENIAVIKLILAFITCGLIVLISQFMGKSLEVNLIIYLFGIYVIINSFSDFFRSVFKAFEKMQYEAYSKILQGVILFIIALFFLLNGYPIIFVVSAFIIASSISFVFTLFLTWNKFTKFWLDLDFGFWKNVIKESWPFALSSLFMVIYFRIDTVMLGIFDNNYSVGIYSSAYNLIFLVFGVTSLLNLSLYPYLSRNKSFKINRLLLYYFSGGFLVALLLFFLSPLIIFIYGPSFMDSIIALKYLGLVSIFLIPNSLFGIYYAAHNQQRFNLKVTGLLSVINIFLNIFLIPLFSYIGAIMSTIFTEFIGTILLYKKFKEKEIC